MTPPPTGDIATDPAMRDFETAAEALRPGTWLRLPQLREAALLLENGRTSAADTLLREFLRANPRAPGALFLLGDVASRMGAYGDAETLLLQCVKAAPAFAPFRFAYANALLRTSKPGDALAEAEMLLEQDGRNPLFRQLKAAAHEATENYAAAAASWCDLIGDYPALPDLWLRYGHALRGQGSKEETISAYRKAIELDPSFGGAWWALADLKTFRFSEAEIERMESRLAAPGLGDEDRVRILFSLGKAYADRKSYERSFSNFAKGNALYRRGIEHDPEALTRHVARNISVFTSDFFRERTGWGSASAAPIFLVGMPRAGSTLVEQILASHSQIEGTRELSDLASLSRQILGDLDPGQAAEYPGVLAGLAAADVERLGERYLDSTRIHRKLGRPHFTDKMGSNFVHIGLLQLILPNARIVDVRRHPLACGFSIFAQLFPAGQNDAYRLSDIGRLYRGYVELMAHFDRVLPGRVHRLFYESLIADSEGEVRRLLDYLALPFEPACLNFHETGRVVTTASSEQVRTPLYRDALEQWRHYEPWLGPLKEALGPVAESYPGVPAFEQTR